MKRLRQCVLIASCLPLCWLAMMAVHELGHCLVAWGTGGRVTKVVLHPLAISRTDVSPNPSPWAVAWGGPLLGSLLPLILFAICRVARNPAAFLARFFTGFCFVTNGVYIFAGAFARVGDAEVLRREGAPLWGLVLFGALTTATGLVLWHRQGIHFGLGKRNGQVNGLATFLSASLLVAFLVVELLLGSSS